MLDANDTEPGYYNVQGTMLIDPAISPDVALVESKHSGLSGHGHVAFDPGLPSRDFSGVFQSTVKHPSSADHGKAD